jgi:hypothetical protein
MTKPHWLTWRAARWAVLAAAIPALWACNSRRLVEPTPAPQQTTNDLFQQSVNNNLDIVFMIDNSSSMIPLQKKLTDNFPVFMNILKGLPNGLPNDHIGVVSSSMGAGRNPSILGCAPGGDQGIFQSAKRGDTATCAAGSLNAGQNFIIYTNGTPATQNFTGDIADAFSCIAPLGDQGCGFEHQFESVLRALGADGAPAPTQNNGFLRPDAYLAIILITNEDDCSAPPDSDLFDSTSSMVSDPLGPLQSYRCNEFGHLCGGKPPPRTPMGIVDLTGTCVSAEDGRLLRVRDVTTAMKNLKADPSKILVAAIAGPPAPYKVGTVPAQIPTDPSPWPIVEHSCVAADGSYADPSIRIAEWVNNFGGNGLFEVICNDTFNAALTGIADAIGKKIGSPCVQGTVLDTTGAPWAAGGVGKALPDCAVVDHKTGTDGKVVDSSLPPCATGTAEGATECWALGAGGTVCPGADVMTFNRPGAPTATDLNSSVSCNVLTCPVGKTKTATGCM